MDLFTIKCETCGAQLNVRDRSAIGEVLECPRCRSFVEVTPPLGWKPPPKAAKTDSSTAEATDAAQPIPQPTPTDSTRQLGKEDTPPPGKRESQKSRPDSPRKHQPTETGQSSQEVTRSHRSKPVPDQPEGGKRDVEPRRSLDDRKVHDNRNSAEERPSHPAVKSTVAASLGSMAAAGIDLESRASATGQTSSQPTAQTATPFNSNTAMAPVAKASGLTAGKLIAIASGGLALCVVIVAAVYFFTGIAASPPDRTPIVTPEVVGPPPVANAPPRSTYVALNESWLPSDTQVIVSLQWSGLTRNSQFAWLQQKLHPAVGEELESICKTLKISQGQISRASWAATDIAAPTEGDLWMLELSDRITGQDELLAKATALDFEVGAYRAYQFAETGWTEPFVIVDRQRVITGHEAQLRALATREVASVASDALQNLLKHVGVGQDLTVLVDLHAVRNAAVDLPSAWLRSWGTVGRQWERIRTGADGAALGLDFGNLLVVQAQFLTSAAHAHDVQISLDELLSAADPWMTAELQSLQERLRDGEFNDRVARKISILVERGLDALSTSVTGLDQKDDDLTLVWVRTRTDEQLSELATAAISSVPAWEARRLASSRALDQAKLQSLIRGLRGFEKATGTFPQGAAGTSSVAAERRLSWIAQLLPYYEAQMGWKDELSFSRPWDVTSNDAVARRTLPAVTNPAIGLERTPEGYPVSHYVGVAGLGEDAALLPAGHERAGLFGYNRKISLFDLQGQASQTMAIAGVSGNLGPWAAGGRATVRPFTTEPYINGPDGFGSGQVDGMFAAMADASVRFINKDIDPNVLRQLVVVGGPKPALPEVAVNPDRGNSDVTSNPPETGSEGSDNVPDAVALPNNAADVADIGLPPSLSARRNLRDRLAFPLQSVTFSQKPLREVVDFLATISGLQIDLDAQQMAAVGTTPNQPVSINLESTSIEEALEATLDQLGLKFAIDQDRLLVTSASAADFKITREEYDLHGLASSEEEKLQLKELLHQFISPEAWDVANGPAAVGMMDDTIIVNHSSAGHAEVAQFLGRLRVARGLMGAEELQRQTWLPVKLDSVYQRSAIARAMPTTSSFFRPTPLLRIVKNLEQKTQVVILLDASAMRTAGVDVSHAVELKLANTSLEQALHELAAKLGLAVVTLDDRTLKITSPVVADSNQATEFLPVGHLLNDERTPQSLESGLRELAPEVSDGSLPLTVHYDTGAECFIVRAPQALLFAIEQWLDSLAE
ncbi:MAG: DUF1559 domain-containing protein [Pirellulales bacterium]|nr:DUF1559 domain-containing protein [Pirellulales bacterium]